MESLYCSLMYAAGQQKPWKCHLKPFLQGNPQRDSLSYSVDPDEIRALTRILKTGVQDSHLEKVGVPLEKVGVLLQKSWSPTNLCIPYIFSIFSILAGSDTFELIFRSTDLTL